MSKKKLFYPFYFAIQYGKLFGKTTTERSNPMKKKYLAAEAEIVRLSHTDIVTSSWNDDNLLEPDED